jgi:hypothetical protein
MVGGFPHGNRRFRAAPSQNPRYWERQAIASAGPNFLLVASCSQVEAMDGSGTGDTWPTVRRFHLRPENGRIMIEGGAKGQIALAASLPL